MAREKKPQKDNADKSLEQSLARDSGQTRRMSDVEKLGIIQSEAGLVADVRSMIAQTREGVARTVNTGMTLLYWRIGMRIQTEVLRNERAEYGKEIVSTLSAQLTDEFGSGFGEKNLRRMIQFAEVFPDEQIVAALRRQLGWTHFKALIPLKDPLKRDFYLPLVPDDSEQPVWSVIRKLADKIGEGVTTHMRAIAPGFVLFFNTPKAIQGKVMVANTIQILEKGEPEYFTPTVTSPHD